MAICRLCEHYQGKTPDGSTKCELRCFGVVTCLGKIDCEDFKLKNDQKTN